MAKVIAWPDVVTRKGLVASLSYAANSFLGNFWQPVAMPARDTLLFDPQKEARQRVRELEAIYAISAALRVASNDEEMVPILLDRTLEVLQSQHGAVILLESGPPAYAVRLGRGCMRKDQGRILPIDVLLNGRRLDLTRAYVTDRLSEEIKGSGLDGDGSLGPGVLMPLRSTTETLGFMLIGRSNPIRFEPTDVDILTAIAEMAGNALHRIRLHSELEESYLGTVLALANAVDAKDTYTGGHSARLAELAAKVARQMGIKNGFFEDLRWGAMLHDIGKIGVPDQILRKPTPLTPEEWEIVRQHPIVGAQILAPVTKLAGAARIVKHHHERWDGNGYPDGLAGEAIPLGGRILSVVDAYSAITDERAYKKSRAPSEAMAELRRCAGTQFDPSIVTAFITSMD